MSVLSSCGAQPVGLTEEMGEVLPLDTLPIVSVPAQGFPRMVLIFNI